MLTQLDYLSRTADGRYASDTELAFLEHYHQSFALRLRTYQKLQAAEGKLLQALQARLQQEEPSLFHGEDLATQRKCDFDTRCILRACLVALLLNDPEVLKERMLYWLQTIMRTFKHHQHRCDMNYRVLQDIVRQSLPESESALMYPLLELTRSMLGEG